MSQAGQFIKGGSSNVVETLTGNSGGAVGPTANNINVLGAGSITVTGNPGTSTLTITDSGGGFMWNVITAASASLVASNGYIANNAGTVTFTLPVTTAVGDMYRVTGINNATGWSIAQNAGQTIHFGASNTTTGAPGSLTSSATRDSIEILCVVANTDFNVLSSIGNITVV